MVYHSLSLQVVFFLNDQCSLVSTLSQLSQLSSSVQHYMSEGEEVTGVKQT